MKNLLLLLLLCLGTQIKAQEQIFKLSDFTISGEAKSNGDQCFILTEAIEWTSGSIWNKTALDLNKSFEMEIDVKLGCSDHGADGIVFVFSPSKRNGHLGEGMGFGGLSPSLGIEIDTYENLNRNDPSYDHIALLKNGSVDHRGNLSRAVPISKSYAEVEDCRKHKLKVVWQAKAKMLKVFFDHQLRIIQKTNLVDEIFKGNSTVYWGFTAATGGSYNRQEVCIEKVIIKENISFDKKTDEDILKGNNFILESIIFDAGKTDLKPESFKELDKLLNLLESAPKTKMVITGHTDSSGDAKKNEALSLKRAEAVVDYLISRGIDKKRLEARGYGESFPVMPNKTAAGRQQNRRIEIYIPNPQA